jgi:hypothetical protein
MDATSELTRSACNFNNGKGTQVSRFSALYCRRPGRAGRRRLSPFEEIEMTSTSTIVRGIVVACALSAASLPALAQTQAKAAGSAARKATLTKEINAAYAEQQGACKRAASSQRAACLKHARTTWQHDLANMRALLADAPSGGVTERIVATSAAAPAPRAPATDASARDGASAYGRSGSGVTGSSAGSGTGSSAGAGSGAGSIDAIPPTGGQAGGLPPPIDQPNPVAPTQPPQGNTPRVQ